MTNTFQSKHHNIVLTIVTLQDNTIEYSAEIWCIHNQFGDTNLPTYVDGTGSDIDTAIQKIFEQIPHDNLTIEQIKKLL